MAKALRTYGLIVEEFKFADSPAVKARVVTKAPDENYPTNGRGDGESSIWDAGPKHDGLMLADLEIFIYHSNTVGAWSQVYVEYRGKSTVDYREAQKMCATLKKIHKQIDKDNAFEAGDVLMSVAKALNLTFYAYIPSGDKWTYSSSQYTWAFDKVAAARDKFRSLMSRIKEAA